MEVWGLLKNSLENLIMVFWAWSMHASSSRQFDVGESIPKIDDRQKNLCIGRGNERILNLDDLLKKKKITNLI